MDVREKLIELLKTSPTRNGYTDLEDIADHLSANGVTVQEWISVKDRLPDNAKYPGALCPRYLVATKYGITEGWYNPDAKGWFIIVIRLTGLYDSERDINFESGDVVSVGYAKDGIVTHWMPLPKPPKEEESK